VTIANKQLFIHKKCRQYSAIVTHQTISQSCSVVQIAHTITDYDPDLILHQMIVQRRSIGIVIQHAGSPYMSVQ